MKSSIIKISSDDESDNSGDDSGKGDVSPVPPEPENRLEMIVGHKIENKKTYFWVHWEGYSEEDRTWEPEQNVLEDAPEHVQAYWDSIYEHEEETDRAENATAVTGKRAGSRIAGAVSKPQKLPSDTETAWSPPAGSWEDEPVQINECRKDGDRLIVYLIWNNGETTTHDTHVIYKKCPQKEDLRTGRFQDYCSLITSRCSATTRGMSRLLGNDIPLKTVKILDVGPDSFRCRTAHGEKTAWKLASHTTGRGIFARFCCFGITDLLRSGRGKFALDRC